MDEIHAQEEREKAAAKEVEVTESTEDVLVAAEAGEAISELAEDDAADETGSEEPDSTESVDYSSMTVAELKEILKEKGLPVSGKKADLIERLSE